MDKIDTTKSYRLANGKKIKSIARLKGGISAWDNRGGNKAVYKLVLDDGTVMTEWYYDTGKRTGETGPDWDNPDNLVTEERYQRSIIRMVCNCGVEEIALVGNYGQGMLRMMEMLPCRKCGCMRVPEPDRPKEFEPEESFELEETEEIVI